MSMLEHPSIPIAFRAIPLHPPYFGEHEETDHPREVAEAALAHRVRSQIEAAYRRSDLFERRRRLMDDWTGYLAGGSRGPETGPVG